GGVMGQTALLQMPVYLVIEPPSRATWRRAVLVLVVPALALGLVIVWKLSIGGVLSGATPIATLAPFARTFRQDLLSLTDAFDLYSTFGVLWLLGLRRLPGATSFQRRALV